KIWRAPTRGHPSAALLRSLIIIINDRYGLMTTVAARDIRDSLVNLMEMTVQVSNYLAVNGTYQGHPVLGLEACSIENNSLVAWIEVEQTGLVTFFNHQGDK
ncbi:hypothetical protein N7467_011321, partial [Penicillium canescens]